MSLTAHDISRLDYMIVGGCILHSIRLIVYLGDARCSCRQYSASSCMLSSSSGCEATSWSMAGGSRSAYILSGRSPHRRALTRMLSTSRRACYCRSFYMLDLRRNANLGYFDHRYPVRPGRGHSVHSSIAYGNRSLSGSLYHPAAANRRLPLR